MNIESFIPFANKIASIRKKNLPKRITFEEIQSASYMGLVESANKFDPNSGTSFTTFAYKRISGAISDYLRELDTKTVSLDDKMDFAQKETNNFEELPEILFDYYFIGKTLKEIGKEKGLSESRISQILKSFKEELKVA